jgi:hypothetical protein
MNNEKQTFDYIWDTSVYPAIKYCISQLDDSLKAQLDFHCENLNDYNHELGKMFIRKREWLKDKYLPEKGEDARLDFHKLSALLCRCIIGNKVFSFNKASAEKWFEKRKNDDTISIEEKMKWQIDNVYINYKLAFWASAGLIYVNLISWAYKRIENEKRSEVINVYTEFLKRLEQEKNLIPYKKSLEHDDFCTSMIVALMKNDLLLRDFDYLNYAASMFQWQEYTKRIIFMDILSDPNKNSGYEMSNIDLFM